MTGSHAARSQRQSAQSARTAEAARDGDALRLLIVDAAAGRRAVLRDRLTEAEGTDWRIEQAADLAGALKALRDDGFHAVLLSLDLPEVEGPAGLRAVRWAHHDVALVVHDMAAVDPADEAGDDRPDRCATLIAAGAEDCLRAEDLSPRSLARSLRFAVKRHDRQRASLRDDDMAVRRRYYRALGAVARRGERTRLTAAAYGVRRLKEQAPQEFSAWVEYYRLLLDMALEERTHKVSNDVDEKLRAMATELGRLNADPRDVVELHTAAVARRRADLPEARQCALWEEGRLLTLKLMGYLTGYYRNRSLQFVSHGPAGEEWPAAPAKTSNGRAADVRAISGEHAAGPV